MKSFFVKYALIPITATMFALWYFSLAMDELRKRIPILDRIFAFFTGKNRNVQALPESTTPSDERKPKAPEPKPSENPAPVEPTKPTPEQKPVQPPAQPPAVVQPVKPTVPKPEPPKTPETPSVPVSVSKPAPVVPTPAPVEPSKVPEPAKPAPTLPKPPVVEEVKPKDVPKPEPVPTPAPASKEPISVPSPAPAPAPVKLIKEKKELPTPTPPKPAATSPTGEVPVLPSNNEDSFIIVEQQKPANNKPGQKPKVDVKNSTMDFLQGEGGRGAVAGAAAPAVPPSSLSADR